MNRYILVFVLFISVLVFMPACAPADELPASENEMPSESPSKSSSAAVSSDEASCDFYSLEDFYRYVMTPEEQWGRYTVDAEAYLPIDKLFPDEEVGGVTVVDENHYLISFVGEDGTNLSNFIFRVQYDPRYEGSSAVELFAAENVFAASIDLNATANEQSTIKQIPSGRVSCVEDGVEATLSVYQGEIRACEFVCGPYLLKFSNLENVIETPAEAMSLVTDFMAK